MRTRRTATALSAAVTSALATALAATLAATPTGSAEAQVLYSNGAANGAGYASFVNSGRPGIRDQFIFDNFLVGPGGWHVTALFGAVFNTFENPLGALFWELRTGMTLETESVPGNVGTVRHSGSSSTYSTAGHVRTIDGLALDLTPGEYWITIYNDAGGDFSNRGAFVQATTGLGALNAIRDRKAIWLVNDGTLVQAQPTDFVFGAIGSAPMLVPEPATAGLVGFGCLVVAGVGGRRQRRAGHGGEQAHSPGAVRHACRLSAAVRSPRQPVVPETDARERLAPPGFRAQTAGTPHVARRLLHFVTRTPLPPTPAPGLPCEHALFSPFLPPSS